MELFDRLLAFFEFTLSPSGWAILFVTFIVVALPVALHVYWFYTASSKILPSFLIVGPSGAGKTSLLTLLETGKPARTHTSQAPLTVECSVPVSVGTASSKYRSVNDPGANFHRTFLLQDTPGHGKLRNYALDSIVKPQHLKGIIYLVDAATLEGDTGNLAEAADYLHDVLLTLQKLASTQKSKKTPHEMPVLIAANKLDLFTALPTKLVKNTLESELTKLRNTKAKGLLDSGIGMDDDLEDREVLGGSGEGKFDFSLLEEYNIAVEVSGGNVLSSDGSSDVKEWWDWIGRHL